MICGAPSCQLGDKEVLLCHICARIATVSHWKTTFGGSPLGRSTAAGGTPSVEKNDWRVPNRLLVVQTCDSVSQAKDVKAHAGPQGLCENLINALKLLANQQKDGDSPIQSKYCNRPLRKKQERYYGGLEKLKKSGQ